VTRTRNRESGLTLIEVMVTMVILVVGLLSMVSLMNSGILMNRKASDDARATQFALKRLEEARNTPFDLVLSKGAGMYAQDAAADTELASFGLATPATWNRQVTTVTTYSGNDSLKTVVVTVSWGTGAQQRDAQMVTYVARTGLNKIAPRLAGN
jgi:prepilin-type N-terminal cleavage/methylation domain-containing protein